jgi:predicted ATPase/class 3 adenylate cyclase
VAELPSGTVTFLFTDLEGSTRLWEEHPDAMRPALARHDAIVRDAIVGHGGHVVKGRGDGIHAVFGTADAAVRAAIDCELAMNAERWLVSEPLRARIGIHTGVAELREGDYFGSAVNRAARLEAIAHGGQIVCSQATADLARDSLADGVTFVDLGEHRLRDLSRPERVFQVMRFGLEREFPPLRSLDVLLTNLPRQLTSFIGRDDEMLQLRGLLDEHRLVTITGVGGVGKTRLSIEVAADVLVSFKDGAWMVELAAADAESMHAVFAAALGARLRPGSTVRDDVIEFLARRDLLLLVDNCEQLVADVAAFVEDVLARAQGVRVLATSREPLGVVGEQIWPVPSLEVADSGSSLESVSATASARLFVDRARLADADFDLDSSNAASVVEICRRLDGIPLAIELAAARTASLQPSEIGGLLDERFRLLTGSRRRGVERHQTLKAAIDWSYALLGELERSVFDRLGVFAGSFDVTAVQAIVADAGIDRFDVLGAIDELVAKSMLVARPVGQLGTRYELLETLRQYALDRLDDRAETDECRRRHAAHFAGVAETIGVGLFTRDEGAWHARLAGELDNLRAAVAWTLDADRFDDCELGLRIIAALAGDLGFSADSEIGAWAWRASELPRLEDSQLAPWIRAGAAAYASLRGDFDMAEQLAGSVADSSDAYGLASSAFATSLTLHGDHAGAFAVIDHAYRVLRDRGDASADLLESERAYIAHRVFGPDVSRDAAEQAVRAARQRGQPSLLAHALATRGMATLRSDPTAALRDLEEGLAIADGGHKTGMTAGARLFAARLYLQRGEAPAAVRSARLAFAEAFDEDAVPLLGGLTFLTVVLLTNLNHPREATVAAAAIIEGGLHPATALSSDAQVDLDAALDACRTALEPSEFDAAWSEGAGMTQQEALAFAASWLDRLADEVGL